MEECQATASQYDVKSARAAMTQEQRFEVMTVVAAQYRQALTEGKVLCAGHDCMQTPALADAYRCWFCGKYFCARCANIHFGDRFK